MTTIRALAFGELGMLSWGASWIPVDDVPAMVACRTDNAAVVLSGRFLDAEQAEPWRIEGDALSLLLSPAGPAARGGAAADALDTVDQLCQVTGRVSIDGVEREINSVGWRGTLTAAFDLAAIESFRQTAAWFEPGEGLSLAAYRSQKSRGHETDHRAGAVLEPEPAPPIEDPRLSTTYDANGLPVKAGLELWFEQDDGEEASDATADRQFTRRAAGEAIGPGIDWEVDGFALHATPLRWHSRGSEGRGVYLLGRRG